MEQVDCVVVVRDVAEILGRREQLPVFQPIAENSVSDVVGCEREAIDFDQQRFVGQHSSIGQLSLDEFALLQIVAGNDEVGGFHFFDPGVVAAVIFAFADDRFATVILFKTAFAFGGGFPGAPITPSRFFNTR